MQKRHGGCTGPPGTPPPPQVSSPSVLIVVVGKGSSGDLCLPLVPPPYGFTGQGEGPLLPHAQTMQALTLGSDPGVPQESLHAWRCVWEGLQEPVKGAEQVQALKTSLQPWPSHVWGKLRPKHMQGLSTPGLRMFRAIENGVGTSWFSRPAEHAHACTARVRLGKQTGSMEACLAEWGGPKNM